LAQGTINKAPAHNAMLLNTGLDWIVHGFMSPPTQYRLYGRQRWTLELNSEYVLHCSSRSQSRTSPPWGTSPQGPGMSKN